MELQKVIGANVKAIRERKKLTLDMAAQISGVSRSMLSQIERGDVNPTISVLWKIANGFKVSFTSFMDRHEEAPTLIRAADIKPLVEADGLYLNYPAFPFREDTLFETYRIRIEPGGSLEAQPHMSGTVEYVTVFSGSVEIRTGGDSFQLVEGDSLSFHADIEHSYRNICGDTVWLSMLIHYE